MKPSYKTIASFSVAVVLVALIVAASFWAFGQIETSVDQRKHSFIVIDRANQIMSALTDTETGQRGYLLTGDEAFLEPYLAKKDKVGAYLEELRGLTLSNSLARKHLDTAAPLIDAKLAVMAQVLGLYRNHDDSAAVALVRKGQGKQTMDSIRDELDGYVELEKIALADHDAALQASIRQLFAFIIAASLFTLLFEVCIALLIYRETQQRLKNLLHVETQHLLEAQQKTNSQLLQTNITLQISEEKLAVTLNSIGDAVITTDTLARVTLLNPLAERLTGWTQADALGLPVAEVFHIINKGTRLAATIPVLETLAHGTIQGLANHTVLIARGGSESDIADSCAPIRDREGGVIGAVLVFRDVTEEYAVQQSLQDSIALNQAIFNTVVDGIITTKATGGVIVTVNAAVEKLFGFSAAELIGQPISLLIPELQQDPCLTSHQDDGLPRELVGRHKDGSKLELEFSLSERWQGKESYVTGIIRDISARKQAEALQSAIFNSANFSSIATDANGVIQIFNVGAERMLGYSAAEVMNTITPADISDPQEVIARAKTLSEELSTTITPGFEAFVFKASRGIEDIYELTYIRKDGTRFPAVVSVTALRDAQDGIIGYLLIGTDNTVRKQIEDQLRLAEESFRLMVESVNDCAIVMLDTEGRVASWNSGAQRIKGYKAEDIIGQHFSRFYPLTDIENGIPQHELNIVTTTGRFEVEGWRARKDGSTFWADVIFSAIRDQCGKLRGYAKLTRDLTERKRLDQVLLDKNTELEFAKLAAEKANLAKSDFLSSMSHELRTPLNAILGFAQLLEVGSPPPTATQIARLQQITKAGWYLLELINEILDLALIESGKLSLSHEPVALFEVMQECQALIETQAQQRDIQLSFVPFDSSWTAYADRTRVKQVLLNLLSNAIKYNREQGTVEINCTESSSGRLRVSIIDSGQGLPVEKMAQLFQPFNRLGQEGGEVEGTGIGLVVTKQLVELMGGSIGVESTVGIGSTFWVELLRDDAPKLAIEQLMLAKLTSKTLKNAELNTLLYVEDNPANLMLVEQILEGHAAIRMLSAKDAKLGIGLARAHLPDVILMDINLPGISGTQALKILREDPTTMHIPVVALSANAMPSDIAKGLDAGFFRYLTKPIKINEFMIAIDEALEKSKIQSTPASIEEQP